jgi:FK506-binding protein 1
MGMSLGEKAILHITSDYGYGTEGAGNGVIPPNADLDFEVELLQIGDEVAQVPGEKAACGACIVQ